MEVLIGYKVLDRDLKSASTPKGHGELQYKMNKWTYHKKNHGPLAVFKRKKDAINYKKNETITYGLCPASCLVICKCVYIKANIQTLLTLTGLFGFSKSSLYDFIPGTDLAEAIMLIQKSHA